MPQRHPHADAIIAYVNGETIQLKNVLGFWIDLGKYQDGGVLHLFHKTNEYRIKPKTKTMWARMYKVSGNDEGGYMTTTVRVCVRQTGPNERMLPCPGDGWIGEWQQYEVPCE